MTRLLLTVPEAAEALAISRSKLYELLASGAVASIRIDGSRRIPLSRPGGVHLQAPRRKDGRMMAAAIPPDPADQPGSRRSSRSGSAS